MDTLTQLQQKNPHIQILPVTDPSFARFGRVLVGAKAAQAVAHARKVWKVEDKVDAVVSVPEFEADTDLQATVGNRVFGGLPYEVGWVFGRNDALTGVEWHQGSEAHIPVEDCVFLLAPAQDAQWNPGFSLDTAAVKAFYCPAGTIVELFQWALHYCPVMVSRKTGFCNLFVLPRTTGNALPFTPDKSLPDSSLMTAVNIWFTGHQESGKTGFHGPLVKINPLD
jgi:ureidoglycolate hydrolase